MLLEQPCDSRRRLYKVCEYQVAGLWSTNSGVAVSDINHLFVTSFLSFSFLVTWTDPCGSLRMDAKALCEYEIAFPSEGYKQPCVLLGGINERKNKRTWERGMERRKEKGREWERKASPLLTGGRGLLCFCSSFLSIANINCTQSGCLCPQKT